MSELYAKPLPKIDPLIAPFWEHAQRRQLAMQVCNSCADVHFPPCPNCPKCLSLDQSWKVMSGRGKIESHVKFHRAYWPGFTPDLPYDACIVRLDEGPVLASNLVGDTSKAKLGVPVHVVFEEVTASVTLPKFEITS